MSLIFLVSVVVTFSYKHFSFTRMSRMAKYASLEIFSKESELSFEELVDLRRV